MGELTDFLESLVADGTVTLGWQAAVYVGGQLIVSDAGGVDGLGRPMRPDSLTAMYCSSKTLLAVAAARLVSDGELSIEDRVGDLVPTAAGALRTCTVGDLMSHRSGLARPTLVEATTLRPEDQLELACRSVPFAPPLGDAETLYSEAASWIVLAACVSEAAGQNHASFVRTQILDRLALTDEFDLDGTKPGRRRVGVSMRDGRVRPLLLELADSFSYLRNPGYGGFATMRGQAMLVGSFAESIRDRNELDILPQEALRFTAPGPMRWDRTFNRNCSFSLGFMTRPDSHGFGTALSQSSFAQAGLTGMTTVAADPESGLAAAVHINGMTDASVSVEWLRPAMWTRVAADASSRSRARADGGD